MRHFRANYRGECGNVQRRVFRSAAHKAEDASWAHNALDDSENSQHADQLSLSGQYAIHALYGQVP